MNVNLCKLTLAPLVLDQHNTTVTTRYTSWINNSIPQSIQVT